MAQMPQKNNIEVDGKMEILCKQGAGRPDFSPCLCRSNWRRFVARQTHLNRWIRLNLRKVLFASDAPVSFHPVVTIFPALALFAAQAPVPCVSNPETAHFFGATAKRQEALC